MKRARIGIIFYLTAVAVAATPPVKDRFAPDIFLITIDTLRADHVHCYGYDRVQTPALDGLALDGIRFTAAFTPSPLTNTSHTSILTGLLPSSHGVTDFAIPLSATHPTWATLLKQNGYHTGAFIGAVIVDSNSLAPGLDQGFDFYDHFPLHPTSNVRWGNVERRGMEVVEHTEAWLKANPTGPHFAWIHLYDAHDPYEPPAPYSQIYEDHLYDGEIAYADSALNHFLAYLKQHGWYQNAIVMVVADHGEGLGEHHEKTHGIFLYNSTLHVPLIIKLPNERDRGRVLDARVQTTDLLPTMLDLLGLPFPVKLDGKSLKTYLEGDGGSDEPALAETDYPLDFGWAPLRAMIEDGMKLIQAPRPELYDLRNDPGELHNLYQPQDATRSKVRQMDAEIHSRMPPPAAALNAMALPDPKDRIEEQNLLHVAMLDIEEQHLDQAREELETVLRLDAQSQAALRQLGELEFRQRKYAEAATHLGQLRALLPSDPTVAYENGRALEKSGDLQGARAALEESLQLNPEQVSAELLLADIYLKLHKGPLAEDRFQAALLLEPANLEAQIGLSKANLMEGHPEEALTVLEPLGRDHRGNAEILQLLKEARAAEGKKSESQPSHPRFR